MRPVVLLAAVINKICLIGLMGYLSLDQFVVMSFINPWENQAAIMDFCQLQCVRKNSAAVG